MKRPAKLVAPPVEHSSSDVGRTASEQQYRRISAAMLGVNPPGVTLSHILESCGRYFVPLDPRRGRTISLQEADEDYKKVFENELEEGQMLDYFISHTWSSDEEGFAEHLDGRFGKLLALLYRFNLVPALVATSLVLWITFVLSATGVLPAMTYLPIWQAEFTKEHCHFALWCSLSGIVTFLTTVLAWTHVRSFAERSAKRPTLLFFDRLCIHQVDEELKTAAIDNLGGYLKRSRTMLILWTPQYLKRLWCVFEYAVRDSRVCDLCCPVEVLPLVMPFVSFAFAGVAYGTVVGFRLSFFFLRGNFTTPATVLKFFSVALVLCSAALGHVTRRYMRHRDKLREAVDQFTVAKAGCRLEQDRRVVTRFIQHYYHGGVAAFETRFHDIGASVIKSVAMDTMVPYQATLPAALLLFTAHLDLVACLLRVDVAHFGDRDRLAVLIAYSLRSLVICFCAGPCVMSCIFQLSVVMPAALTRAASHSRSAAQRLAARALMLGLQLALAVVGISPYFFAYILTGFTVWHTPPAVSIAVTLACGAVLLLPFRQGFKRYLRKKIPSCTCHDVTGAGDGQGMCVTLNDKSSTPTSAHARRLRGGKKAHF